MNLGNIGSVKYRPDLNKIYWSHKDQTKFADFLQMYGADAINRGLDHIIREVVPAEEGDIHLESLLSNSHKLYAFGGGSDLTMLVYPSKGEVKEYLLTENDFFTNAHANPDLLVVRDFLDTILIGPPQVKNPLVNWDVCVPQTIYAALFFKTNPFRDPSKYDGFQEFLDYKPRR